MLCEKYAHLLSDFALFTFPDLQVRPCGGNVLHFACLNQMSGRPTEMFADATTPWQVTEPSHPGNSVEKGRHQILSWKFSWPLGLGVYAGGAKSSF